MRIRTSALLGASFIILVAGGCVRTTPTYIPAAPTGENKVAPNPEGAGASIGGYETTVTPRLETSRLVAALPDPKRLVEVTAGEARERHNPIPLPDGTRDEYTSVERTYVRSAKTPDEVRFTITISDTRSLPVLTAFVKSYTEFENESGFRKRETVEGTDAWVLYAYDPARSRSGFGSVTMLYRGRFLIVIDGSLGATKDDLVALISAFDYSQLR